MCFVMFMEELRCHTEVNYHANPTNSHGREKFYFLETENNSQSQRLQINLRFAESFFITMEELYVLQLWVQTCSWVLFARVQDWVRVESKPSSCSVTLAFSHELRALCLSLPPQFFFPMKAICLNSYQLITLYCRNTA